MFAVFLFLTAPRVDRIEALTTGSNCAEFPAFAGDKVVYDAFADGGFGLFSMDLATRKVQRLTQQDQSVWEYWQGWDYAPAPSPDGKRIAYLHETSEGAELRIIPIKGDSGEDPLVVAQITDIEPQWIGPSSIVAVSRKDEVWRFDLPSKTPHLIGQVSPPWQAYGLQVFADGEVIIRAEKIGTRQLVWTLLGFKGGKMQVVPLDTSALRFKGGLPTADDKSFYHVVGNHFDEAQMMLRPRAGGPGSKIPITDASMGFSIAADRKRMVYSSCYEFNTLVQLRDGKTVAELLPRSGHERYASPARFGDGAVLYSIRDTASHRVSRLDLVTKKITELASGDEPSSDGKRVVYIQYDKLTPLGVAVDGKLVTHDGRDRKPRFARDGTLYYLRADTLMNDKGLSIANVGAYALSPIEDRVVYYAIESGTLKQRVGNKMSDLTTDKTTYQDLAFKRDGQEVYAVRGQKELVAVPLQGTPRLITDAGYQGITAISVRDDDTLIAAVRLWSGHLKIAHGVFP